MEVGISNSPLGLDVPFPPPRVGSSSLPLELERKDLQIRSLDGKLTRVRKKLAGTRSQLKRRSLRFRRLQHEWDLKGDTLRSQISELGRENENLKRRLNEKSAEVIAEKPTETLHDPLMVTILTKLKTSVARLYAENEKLKVSNSTYASNFRSLQAQLRNTSTRLEERLSEMRSSSVERLTLRAQVGRLEGELRDRDVALEQSDVRVRQVMGKLDDAHGTIRRMETTIENLKAESEVVQSKADHAEVRSEGLLQERLAAERSARKARDDFVAQKDLVLRQQRALEAAEQKYNSDVPRLEAQLKDAGAEMTRMNRLLCDAQLHLAEETKNREKEVSSVSRQLTEEKERLRQRLESEERRCRDLEGNLEKTRDQLSTSLLVDDGGKAKEVEIERLQAENRELAVQNAGFLEKVEGLRVEKHRAVSDLEVSRRVAEKLKKRLKVTTKKYQEIVLLHQRNQVEFAELQGMLEVLEKDRDRAQAAKNIGEVVLEQARAKVLESGMFSPVHPLSSVVALDEPKIVDDALQALIYPELSPLLPRSGSVAASVDAPAAVPSPSHVGTSGDVERNDRPVDSPVKQPSPVAPRRRRRRRPLTNVDRGGRTRSRGRGGRARGRIRGRGPGRGRNVGFRSRGRRPRPATVTETKE